MDNPAFIVSRFACQQYEGRHHVVQCKAYSLPMTLCVISLEIERYDPGGRIKGHSAPISHTESHSSHNEGLQCIFLIYAEILHFASKHIFP